MLGENTLQEGHSSGFIAYLVPSTSLKLMQRILGNNIMSQQFRLYHQDYYTIDH